MLSAQLLTLESDSFIPESWKQKMPVTCTWLETPSWSRVGPHKTHSTYERVLREIFLTYCTFNKTLSSSHFALKYCRGLNTALKRWRGKYNNALKPSVNNKAVTQLFKFLPDNHKHEDGRSKVIRLKIKQIADHSVIPFAQIRHIRFGESVNTRKKIIPGSQRCDFHPCHDAIQTTLTLAVAVSFRKAA